MKTLKLTIVALCFLAVITACEKEGPIGPQGPLGEQGPQGETGGNGPKGDKGDKGTANVVASAWADYDWNSVNTPTVKRMKVVVPSSALEKVGAASLKEFMASGGVLLIYGKNWTNNYPFPFSDGSSYEILWYYDSGQNGFIIIHLHSLNNKLLNEAFYGEGNQFRYVLIAPGSLISGYKSPKEVNWSGMDFENASQLLGIKD